WWGWPSAATAGRRWSSRPAGARAWARPWRPCPREWPGGSRCPSRGAGPLRLESWAMATAEPAAAAPHFKKSVAREYLESIAVAVILALFIRTYVVQAFKIPTGSMETNLLIGDHLLVNKIVYSPSL